MNILEYIHANDEDKLKLVKSRLIDIIKIGNEKNVEKKFICDII